MSYPKYHGITLAANSVIENLHLERLATDPTPVTAGRLWVNTTEKAIKFSGLDAGGAVVIQSFTSAADLIAAIADSKAYTDAAITTLSGTAPELLNTLGEISTALNNDPDLYNTIVAMIGTNIEAAKAELRGAVSTSFDTLVELETGLTTEIADRTTAVAAESAARASADVTLQSNIDTVTANLSTEATTRASADTALDSRLTTVESQASGKIGDLTTLTTIVKTDLVSAINELDSDIVAEAAARVTAISTEAAARSAADTTLTTDLIAEVSRAEAAEGVLQGNIDSEAAARAAADTALQNNINTEASARAAADTTLTNALATEVARAEAAEVVLTTAVSDEAARATAAEVVLQGNITAEAAARVAADSAEATARATADTAIATAVNAGKFSYTADAAALTHTIAHNLNTSPVLVSVYVQGDDGKYRNDMVAVEETDNNTITIGLTESRKVKIAVLSLAAI